MAGFMDQLAQGLNTVGNSMMVNNNPTWAKLAQSQQQNDIMMAEQQDKEMRREALRRLAQEMQGDPSLDRQTALLKYAEASGDFDPLFNPTSQGGGTGYLVQRLMAENPRLSYSDALAQVQTGYRKGVNFEGGTATPIDGLGGALAQLGREENRGKETGTLEAQVELKPRIEYDVTKAAADARAQADREAGIGGAEENANRALEVLDAALADKEGMEATTGGLFGMQGRQAATLPLSAAQRRYQPYVDQLKGQAFLQAFESLKGGGQITEVEGKKATEAMARLNQAQDTKDFEAALKDLRDVVATGIERQKTSVQYGAGKQPNAPAASGGKRRVISFGDLQ